MSRKVNQLPHKVAMLGELTEALRGATLSTHSETDMAKTQPWIPLLPHLPPRRRSAKLNCRIPRKYDPTSQSGIKMQSRTMDQQSDVTKDSHAPAISVPRAPSEEPLLGMDPSRKGTHALAGKPGNIKTQAENRLGHLSEDSKELRMS